MSILLTGANGFLGKIISSTLNLEDIIALGKNNNSTYQFDLTNGVPRIGNYFEMVIHCAGKAHSIPKNLIEKQDFFNVNVKGTQNLLTSLENVGVPASFVFISTVSVYGLSEGKLINENTPLLAQDPYGLSKIQAESLIQKWCAQNNVICTILRLPLIAGLNPPGNLKAMIKGITKGYYFNITGGRANKSIVLAKDVAKIIPKAAEVGGVFNLTDGYHPSFSELSELIAKQLNKSKPADMPYWFAKTIALTGDIIGNKVPINSDKLKKITSDLTFDDSKAREILGWNPTPVLEGFKIF